VLRRRGRGPSTLKQRAENDPVKLAVAAWLRREATLMIRWSYRLFINWRQTLVRALPKVVRNNVPEQPRVPRSGTDLTRARC
jgi:hypothetical protein